MRYMTSLSFTQFHLTAVDVIKVDDDISIGLVGKVKGTVAEKKNVVCLKYQRHFRSHSVMIYFV